MKLFYLNCDRPYDCSFVKACSKVKVLELIKPFQYLLFNKFYDRPVKFNIPSNVK